jgi:hypothetical protein
MADSGIVRAIRDNLPAVKVSTEEILFLTQKAWLPAMRISGLKQKASSVL